MDVCLCASFFSSFYHCAIGARIHQSRISRRLNINFTLVWIRIHPVFLFSLLLVLFARIYRHILRDRYVHATLQITHKNRYLTIWTVLLTVQNEMIAFVSVCGCVSVVGGLEYVLHRADREWKAGKV